MASHDARKRSAMHKASRWHRIPSEPLNQNVTMSPKTPPLQRHNWSTSLAQQNDAPLWPASDDAGMAARSPDRTLPDGLMRRQQTTSPSPRTGSIRHHPYARPLGSTPPSQPRPESGGANHQQVAAIAPASSSGSRGASEEDLTFIVKHALRGQRTLLKSFADSMGVRGGNFKDFMVAWKSADATEREKLLAEQHESKDALAKALDAVRVNQLASEAGGSNRLLSDLAGTPFEQASDDLLIAYYLGTRVNPNLIQAPATVQQLSQHEQFLTRLASELGAYPAFQHQPSHLWAVMADILRRKLEPARHEALRDCKEKWGRSRVAPPALVENLLRTHPDHLAMECSLRAYYEELLGRDASKREIFTKDIRCVRALVRGTHQDAANPTNGRFTLPVWDRMRKPDWRPEYDSDVQAFMRQVGTTLRFISYTRFSAWLRANSPAGLLGRSTATGGETLNAPAAVVEEMWKTNLLTGLEPDQDATDELVAANYLSTLKPRQRERNKPWLDRFLAYLVKEPEFKFEPSMLIAFLDQILESKQPLKKNDHVKKFGIAAGSTAQLITMIEAMLKMHPDFKGFEGLLKAYVEAGAREPVSASNIDPRRRSVNDAAAARSCLRYTCERDKLGWDPWLLSKVLEPTWDPQSDTRIDEFRKNSPASMHEKLLVASALKRIKDWATPHEVREGATPPGSPPVPAETHGG